MIAKEQINNAEYLGNYDTCTNKGFPYPSACSRKNSFPIKPAVQM